LSFIKCESACNLVLAKEWLCYVSGHLQPNVAQATCLLTRWYTHSVFEATGRRLAIESPLCGTSAYL